MHSRALLLFIAGSAAIPVDLSGKQGLTALAAPDPKDNYVEAKTKKGKGGGCLHPTKKKMLGGAWKTGGKNPTPGVCGDRRPPTPCALRPAPVSAPGPPPARLTACPPALSGVPAPPRRAPPARAPITTPWGTPARCREMHGDLRRASGLHRLRRKARS